MAILFHHLSIATCKYIILSLISVVVSRTQFFILEVVFVKTCGNINIKISVSHIIIVYTI